ncbi:flagellar motor switch protein FliN [Gracilinema caldarium]|uniref:flagellar motor switch protein FliN n=1 Tax=Gracilinema caldarium TaxID=215591 RepID=UPI0026EB2853|nr:flagellar motor switch protein FliN [Gracilinema caldarium]
MSDGALSQDEIDALLAGVDSSSLGMPAASSGGGISEQSKALLQDYLVSTVQTQSSNLSMMMGTNVIMQLTQLDGVNRESFLQKVPDMVVAVKADFTAGFPGEHVFVLSEEGAKKIASLMNKEENIELDDMALSVISEIISQLTGTQITTLSEKTGNKSIASISPEASFVPKAVVALPNGDFVRVTYQLSLGDGSTLPLWEIYGPSVVQDITAALSGGSAGKGANMQSMAGMGNMPMGGASMGGFGGTPAMGGMGMPAMQAQAPMGGMGMGGAPMGGMPMGGMGAFPGMGQNPAAGFGSYGMAGGSTNVQPVQFPSLVPQASSAEQGNIGLIMDVYMEMTVELGRTKKLIKEILGMGEGTIIELDKLAGEPVDILVNHKLIAKGEVVVIDENFGVRVTEIVSPMERMSDMG